MRKTESNYNQVMELVDGLKYGEMVSIEVPENLGLFRKNLCEIGQRLHKKFATKIRGGKLYLMRVRYYSVNEKLSEQ